MGRFHWSMSKRIITVVVFVVIILMAFILYANSTFNYLLAQYDMALEYNKHLNSIFGHVDNARLHLRNFCINGVADSEGAFWEEYRNAYRLIDDLKTYIDDPHISSRLRDLRTMLQSYESRASEAIYLYTNYSLVAAYSSLVSSERINTLIRHQYVAYSQMLTQRTELTRQSLLNAKNRQNFINFAAIVGLIIFCGTFAGIFIKAQIHEQLMKEENRNLRTEALLKETELNALHSKIKPHFLFNTLNMIQQTAYLENAQETRTMIEATAHLLRFYLDSPDMNVSLLEELEYASEYIYIQQKRMGSRIHFDVQVDPDITNLVIPGLIIQPILENAIMHGLINCISGGKIEIRVQDHDEWVSITIKDNGAGMADETIKKILENQFADTVSETVSKTASKTASKTVSDTGRNSIGLRNIIKRLNLFFDQEGLIQQDGLINQDGSIKQERLIKQDGLIKQEGLIKIESEEGEYTCVEIRLPKK